MFWIVLFHSTNCLHNFDFNWVNIGFSCKMELMIEEKKSITIVIFHLFVFCINFFTWFPFIVRFFFLLFIDCYTVIDSIFDSIYLYENRWFERHTLPSQKVLFWIDMLRTFWYLVTCYPSFITILAKKKNMNCSVANDSSNEIRHNGLFDDCETKIKTRIMANSNETMANVTK